ncbi:MAG: hypothetical protein B0D83_00085, partial [Candidatus Sedimenticola endophacoides]
MNLFAIHPDSETLATGLQPSPRGAFDGTRDDPLLASQPIDIQAFSEVMTSPEVLSSVIGQLRLMLPEEVFSRIEALIRDGKALPQPAELAALLEKVIQQLETKAGGKAVAEAVAGPSPAPEAGEAGAAGPTPLDLLRRVKQHLEHSAETDGEPAVGLPQG